MLEAPAVQDGLAHEIQQGVDLLGRDADRASFLGCLRFRSGGRLRIGRKLRLGASIDGLGNAGGELMDERFDRLATALQVLAQSVGSTQQGLGQLRTERSALARRGENILHRMRELTDLVHANHSGGALDRVRVAKERVDGVAAGPPALEREQRLDDPIQALAGLVAEDLQKFGLDLGHAACSSSTAKTRATSMTPTSWPSSSVACTR